MNKRKDSRQSWESFDLNNRTYQMYYNRLNELAINMFEWKNVPPSIDVRFLELMLFCDGMVVFFKDDELKETGLSDESGTFLCLQCMINGPLDVYRIPTKRRAYAVNGYNQELNENNSVIIFNNYLHTNCLNDIEMFSRRLYEIERTIDTNIIAQKTPVLIKATETQRLTLKNLYKEYSGNEPFIFGDADLDLKSIEAISTNAPFIAQELNMLKHEYYNEALTYLGIQNINVQKKERMVTDEVQRSMGGIEAQKLTRLNARKDACKKINAMFGLNIDVEFRELTNYDEQETETKEETKGGEDNE